MADSICMRSTTEWAQLYKYQVQCYGRVMCSFVMCSVVGKRSKCRWMGLLDGYESSECLRQMERKVELYE